MNPADRSQPARADEEGPFRAGAESHPNDRKPGAQGWLRWLAVVGWFEALLVAASMLPMNASLSPIVAFAIGFCAVVASVIATSLATPRFSPRALPLLILPALLLGLLGFYPGVGLDRAVAVTAALLLGGTLLGTVVGQAIEHPGQLVFVAIVSSAADVLSVFHTSGPSAALAQSEAALSVLALPWPMLGIGSVEPFLGAGDIVFTALYVACARRHALLLKRAALALAAGFALTLVAVVVFEAAIPALPLLGLAVIVAEPAARRPLARDRMRGYGTALGLVLIVAALLFGQR